ncbi:MAG: 16S rRNA (guanine(966)-N(2))-methyltransferase RsmD [Oscillospiraceae bacterium]
MRIIAGQQRGRKLFALEGDQVRPTSDRVKEALFNILQFQIEGRRFLDLFAGSGQIGLEALSRGADEAVFVDFSKKSIAVIEKNLETVGLSAKAQVYNADSTMFIGRTADKFDVAFLDPPYSTSLLNETLPLVAAAMNGGGVIVCEHPSTEILPESAGDFQKVKFYRYGKICLTQYRNILASERMDRE